MSTYDPVAEALAAFRSLDTPVGAVEIADRLRVLPQTVAQWRQRGLLPDPDWTVGGRPAWAWSTIEAWAKETGRFGGRGG